jgi:hypothetical protein
MRLLSCVRQVIGFEPRFADERLHALVALTSATRREIGSALEATDRVYVVDSDVGRKIKAFKQYRADLTTLIASNGFKLQSQSGIGSARIYVWQRAGTESPSG